MLSHPPSSQGDLLKDQGPEPSISRVWKEKIPYRESLALQEDLKKKALKSRRAFFLGFECPATITLGLRGKKEKDLRQAEGEYARQGIEIVPIKRGGQATLHSPGQLVLYPVMDLLQWKIRPRDFLSLLERITQETCRHYGVPLEKKEDSAGLFTHKGKVAFFGIHISNGVSQHGLALNVHNDLKLFELISSCGMSHRPHDSLQAHLQNSQQNHMARGPTEAKKPRSLTLKEVFNTWCEKASALFLNYACK